VKKKRSKGVEKYRKYKGTASTRNNGPKQEKRMDLWSTETNE
jgi:hypothetical protein